MTPKFLATQYKKRGPLVTQDGAVYKRIHHFHSQYHPQVGDIVVLGKRLTNQHHGNPTVWELWNIVVESTKFVIGGNRVVYPNHPKLWYGDGRYIFLRE